MNPSLKEIELAVAARYRLTRDQMRGPDRRRAISRPRHIAMFLARELTRHSFPRIGAHFCRDHSTVIVAVAGIEMRIASDPRFAAEVERCREILVDSCPHLSLSRKRSETSSPANGFAMRVKKAGADCNG